MKKTFLENLKKMNILINFEIAIAFALSIFISNIFGLQNYLTAGVITLLSIQLTKKQTIIIAIKRVVGYMIVLILSILIFNFMGYNIISFGVLVFIFGVINSYMDIAIGFAPNIVMATHFYLAESTSMSWILNETAIYLIGVLMALIVNLTIPITNEKLKYRKIDLDNCVKRIIMLIANLLEGNYKIKSDISDRQVYELYIENRIKKTYKYFDSYRDDLIKHFENKLLNSNIYELDYLNMRREQVDKLNEIFHKTKYLESKNLKQSKIIADFLKEVNLDFHERNNVEKLLDRAYILMDSFKNDTLPSSRDEFEKRAILYIIMNEIIQFLKMKNDFLK